jgi:hypothetical protein
MELTGVLLSFGKDAESGPGAQGDGAKIAPRGEAREAPRTSAVVFAFSASAYSLVGPWWPFAATQGRRLCYFPHMTDAMST